MLHPVEAEADNLGTAMRDLGVIAEKVFAVQAVVQSDDELPIPSLTVDEDSHDALVDSHDTPPSMHLYRIAQEALSNAIRHGGAKNLWIIGIVCQGRGEMVIADDGIGLTPLTTSINRHAPRTGMGLRIMTFRAARFGGKFTLEVRPEGGLRVTVSRPLPTQN